MDRRRNKRSSSMRRRRRRQHEQQATHRSTNRPVHQQSSRGSDLPGFYYDETVDRYFRIASDVYNPNCPYTESRVRRMKMEREQQSSRKSPETLSRSSSVLHLMSKLKIGESSSATYQKEISKCRVTDMRLVVKQNVFCGTADENVIECNSAGRLFAFSQPGRGDIVGIFPDDNGPYRVQQWFTAMSADRVLGIKSGDSPMAYCKGQVTDACLAPIDSDRLGVLWTTVPLTGVTEVTLMPFSLSPEDEVDDDTGQLPWSVKFSFGRTSAWSCAWNQATVSIAVGLEKRNLILGAYGNRHLRTYNGKSNSYGLCFNSTGKLLYSSTSNKEVAVSDLQNNNESKWTYSFNAGKPVTYLQILTSDLLLTGGHDNLLSVYDLRMRRPVAIFTEHQNQSSMVKPVVCAEDDLLFCVGSDCTLRTWDLKTAHLLNTLRPATDVSVKNIAVTYMPQREVGRSTYVPTLVVFAQNDLYAFQSF